MSNAKSIVMLYTVGNIVLKTTNYRELSSQLSVEENHYSNELLRCFEAGPEVSISDGYIRSMSS